MHACVHATGLRQLCSNFHHYVESQLRVGHDLRTTLLIVLRYIHNVLFTNMEEAWKDGGSLCVTSHTG